MPLKYEIEEEAAISEIVAGRASSAAMKKFFQRHVSITLSRLVII